MRVHQVVEDRRLVPSCRPAMCHNSQILILRLDFKNWHMVYFSISLAVAINLFTVMDKCISK
jgi:hypothetical protein